MVPIISSRQIPPPPPAFLPKTSSTFPLSSSGWTWRSRFCPPPRSTSKFEIDPVKAREALEKLDQQLQSLSSPKQESLPEKRRPSASSSFSEPDVLIGARRTEEMLQNIPGSYLAYSAVALLILTLFNNIVFNVFIKPSVDGENPAAASTFERRVPLMDPRDRQVITTACSTP